MYQLASGVHTATGHVHGRRSRTLRKRDSKHSRDFVSCLFQLAREVLDIAASHVRPGITTDEIDAIVHEATIERNAYPSPLNYRNFPKSVCTYVLRSTLVRELRFRHPYIYLFLSKLYLALRSVNEAICHGIPDQRKLQEGDIVNIGIVHLIGHVYFVFSLTATVFDRCDALL